MLIPGDVIYPAGNVNEYPEKFCKPYSGFPGPIHAVPGNHDWYDGLYGFMVHGWFYIPPDQAAGIMAERLSLEPTRSSDRGVTMSANSRRAARIVFPLPGQARAHGTASSASFSTTAGHRFSRTI